MNHTVYIGKCTTSETAYTKKGKPYFFIRMTNSDGEESPKLFNFKSAKNPYVVGEQYSVFANQNSKGFWDIPVDMSDKPVPEQLETQAKQTKPVFSVEDAVGLAMDLLTTSSNMMKLQDPSIIVDLSEPQTFRTLVICSKEIYLARCKA